MKIFKIITAALALTATFAASAQTRVMYVNDGSGNITKHIINSGTKITFGMENPQDFTDIVDLGLSVKWASCNLGAALPESYGNFYAFAETEPKQSFTLENYKWYDPYEQDTAGYWAFGEISGTSNDAATVALGDLWRMPTQAEWQELVTLCNWQYTKRNGVAGYEVTGPNGKQIFLPGAGNIWDDQGGHTHEGSGFYWTSTAAELNQTNYFIYRGNFTPTEVTYDGYDSPETGMSIRPVYGAAVSEDVLPVPDPKEPVDLGISVKWSSINLGGETPGDYGNYYPWACLNSPERCSDDTYKYYDFRTDTWTYIPDYSGDVKYDAAAALWGNGWRTPTKDEFQELIDNCDYSYETQNGHQGYKLTSRKNGNSIFLACGGEIGPDGWIQVDPLRNKGYYWSSTPFDYDLTPDFAYYLLLTQLNYNDTQRALRVDWLWKSTGFNIRPVHN